MSPYRRSVRKQIGRRGLLLILAGSAWAMLGYQIATDPRIRFSSDPPESSDILAFMDHGWWGYVWMMAGIMAVVMGFFRNRQPFFGRDDIGFNFILTPTFVWSLFYLWSWVAHLTTDGDFGQGSASYGLVVWGLISAFIMTIAGWPEEASTTEEEDAKEKARHRARKRRG